MAQLNDDMMTDVGLGADISNTELRDLKAIILPQITKSIDDLRKVLKIYTSSQLRSRPRQGGSGQV